MTGERVIYKWGELKPSNEFALPTIGTSETIVIELKKEYAGRYVPQWSCDSGNNTSSWNGVPSLGQMSFSVTALSAGYKNYYCHLIDKQGGAELGNFTVKVYSGMYAPIRKIYFHRTLVETAVGRRRLLEVNVEPADSKSQIRWTVANSNFVRDEGVGSTSSEYASFGPTRWFTALAIGDARITVSSLNSDVSDTATLRIKPEPTSVDRMVLYNNAGHGADQKWRKAYLGYGEKLEIVAVVYPEIDYRGVTWSSSNSSVASVSPVSGNWGAPNGFECSWSAIVTAGKESGTAVIRVASNKTPGTYIDFTIIVKPTVKHVKQISVVPSKTSVSKNGYGKLTAVLYPTDADDQTVFWTTHIGSKVSVDQEGNIKGVSKGSGSRIIAIANDGLIEDYSVVNVVDGPVNTVTVNGVTLSSSSIVMKKGATQQVTAILNTSGGTDESGVVCESENSSVADKYGSVTKSSSKYLITVKAKAVGTTKIKVKSATNVAKYATLTVTVVDTNSEVYTPVNRIVANPTSVKIAAGSDFILLGQSVLESAGTAGYSGDVTFTSNNPAVASVSEIDTSSSSVSKALINGNASGSAVITVASSKDSSKTASCLVTVSEASQGQDGTVVNPVESIVISLNPIG